MPYNMEIASHSVLSAVVYVTHSFLRKVSQKVKCFFYLLFSLFVWVYFLSILSMRASHSLCLDVRKKTPQYTYHLHIGSLESNVYCMYHFLPIGHQ